MAFKSRSPYLIPQREIINAPTTEIDLVDSGQSTQSHNHSGNHGRRAADRPSLLGDFSAKEVVLFVILIILGGLFVLNLLSMEANAAQDSLPEQMRLFNDCYTEATFYLPSDPSTAMCQNIVNRYFQEVL